MLIVYLILNSSNKRYTMVYKQNSKLAKIYTGRNDVVPGSMYNQGVVRARSLPFGLRETATLTVHAWCIVT